MPEITCPSCQRVAAQGVFCTHCGSQLPPPNTESVRTCHKCAARVKPTDKFCTACGVVLPDHCACGAVIKPTARFCTTCGAARPDDAKPLFDMSEFTDFEDNMICHTCGYRGKMPVIKRTQTNSNPLSDAMYLSSSVGQALRRRMIANFVDDMMTTDHVYVICPNCRKTGHWKP